MNLKENYNELKSILGLSWSLAKANFKTRNEGSYLGIFWYLLEPLAMFLIILTIGKFITRTDIEKYPIYLLLGLIMFNFFRQSTINSVGSIGNNSNFIKSIKTRPESFVISGVLQFVFSHFFEILVLIGFLVYFHINLTGLIFYPLIFLFFIMFIIGLSLILSTLGVYINDLNNVWSVIVNLLWFSTPIFYVISANNLTIINRFNPIFYFIDSARSFVIYNKIPVLIDIIMVFLLGIIFLITGILIFGKYKNKFAEMI